MVKDLTDDTFTSATSDLALVEFSAIWCGSCHQAEKNFASLATRFKSSFPNLVWAKVDLDQCPRITSQVELFTVPTFIFYVRGNEQARHTKIDPESLTQFIHQQIASAKSS
jgi:thioredoxin-like negative regulator of GroEL